MPQKDNCTICHGEKGGVPGNENIVNGITVCDYCHAEMTTDAPDRPLVGHSLGIARYIMQEVKNQGYEPGRADYTEACTCMALAWGFIDKVDTKSLTDELVEFIGAIVHPTINSGGFRICGVIVGQEVKPNFEAVPRLIKEWVAAVHAGRLSPNEAYIEFENIHPFEDGNGRTGKIIFNWLNKTLDAPVWPEVPSHWRIP